MPENNALPLAENVSSETMTSSEENESAISFADLIVDRSLVPIRVKLVKTKSSKQDAVDGLLTELQCEV